MQDDEQLEVEAQENLPSMGGMGGTGWTPDALPGQGGARVGGAAAAAKLAAKARRKKAAAKANNAFDELLGEGKAGGAEAFPQSRGLVKR